MCNCYGMSGCVDTLLQLAAAIVLLLLARPTQLPAFWSLPWLYVSLTCYSGQPKCLQSCHHAPTMCCLRVPQGPDIAIHHSEAVLANMNAWCQEHHNKSGLVQRVRDSSTSLQEAEQQVLAFIQEHTEYQTAQLAGNSIHIDRLFLQRHMPKVLEHLHYRIVDVSTFKECCR